MALLVATLGSGIGSLMVAVNYLDWTATSYDGIRPAASGDPAWCRVVQLAEEFGISVSYEHLVLEEHRGG